MEKKKQKEKNSNLKLLSRSSRSFPLVCVFQFNVRAIHLCGFPAPDDTDYLKENIPFRSQGHTPCPNRFISFTSVEVI